MISYTQVYNTSSILVQQLSRARSGERKENSFSFRFWARSNNPIKYSPLLREHRSSALCKRGYLMAPGHALLVLAPSKCCFTTPCVCLLLYPQKNQQKRRTCKEMIEAKNLGLALEKCISQNELVL